MRCTDCVKEPLNGHYCECCGRELSLKERKASEITLVTMPDPPVPEVSRTSSSTPCASCGGPSTDGDLCRWCQRTFGSRLKSEKPEARPSEATPAGTEDATSVRTEVEAIGESPWSDFAPSQISSAAEMPTVVSAPAPPLLAVPSGQPEATKAAKAEAPRPASTSKAAAVSKPAKVARRSRYRLALVAAVVLTVISAARWRQVQRQPAMAPEEPQMVVAENAAPVQRSPATKPASAAVKTAAADRRSPAPPAQQAISDAPKPRTPTPVPRPRKVPMEAAVRVVRTPTATVRDVAFIPVAVPAPVASAPTAPRAAEGIATALPAAPPAAPVGPFFETTDVTESPRVATRVKPELPDDLRDRSINDVVVVRVLVSQSGHPSRVSMLRRSKAGPRLDSAVVAAVNQWTFSPARKRGEAVSCWFNMGVPIGGAD